MDKPLTAVFDLDGTVICSKHRQITKPCGSLDLDAWRANSTREHIFSDTLLPVANLMRKMIAREDCNVVICTARVMTQHDFDFLAHHGLLVDDVRHRDETTENLSDADLKVQLLKDIAHEIEIMYDDNISVIRALTDNLGIKMCHPEHYPNSLMEVWANC